MSALLKSALTALATYVIVMVALFVNVDPLNASYSEFREVLSENLLDMWPLMALMFGAFAVSLSSSFLSCTYFVATAVMLLAAIPLCATNVYALVGAFGGMQVLQAFGCIVASIVFAAMAWAGSYQLFALRERRTVVKQQASDRVNDMLRNMRYIR